VTHFKKRDAGVDASNLGIRFTYRFGL